MRGLFVTAKNPFKFEILPYTMPIPGPDEVLVLNKAAMVIPNLNYALEMIAPPSTFPQLLGVYCSGDVIQTGDSPEAQSLQGKRVFARCRTTGCYAKYLAIKANQCYPLLDNVSYDQACVMENVGMSAYRAVDFLQERNPRAFVINAAQSTISKILRRWAQRNNVACICIVRSDSRAAQLQNEGEEHVLNSTDPNFQTNLEQLAERLGASVFVDMVGGNATHVIQEVMPRDSVIALLGTLSQELYSPVNTRALITRNQTISPIFLFAWDKFKTLEQQRAAYLACMEGLNDLYHVDIQRHVTTLEELVEALAELQNTTLSGRMVLNLEEGESTEV